MNKQTNEYQTQKYPKSLRKVQGSVKCHKTSISEMRVLNVFTNYSYEACSYLPKPYFESYQTSAMEIFRERI